MTSFEYHAAINDLVPRSLHFFEREEYRSGEILGTDTTLKPHIIMDAEGRMLAVRVFAAHLALLPLVSGVADEGAELESGKVTADGVDPASTVIHFATHIDPRLKNVRSVVFLPGFLSPTLAILHDRGSNYDADASTMPLRCAVTGASRTGTKETCAVMIVAIETGRSASASTVTTAVTDYQFTVINNIENIPWDCASLHPLPKPVGGLLLACTNLLLWCDISSSTAPYAIALNSFAPLSYAGRIGITQFQSLAIPSLHRAVFLPLGAQGDMLQLLLLVRTGERLLLSISRSGRTLGFFNIERMTLPPSAPPSDATTLPNGCILVASEGGNCQLLGPPLNSKNGAGYANGANGAIDAVDAIDASVAASPAQDRKHLVNDDNLDAYLYGDETTASASATATATATTATVSPTKDDQYLATLEREERSLKRARPSPTASATPFQSVATWTLLDELVCLGPAIDVAVGCSSGDARELVVLGGAFTDDTGRFHDASINILTRQVRPAITASFSLPETRAVWTVSGAQPHDTRYLVASTASATLVLTASQARIVELEESDFHLEGPTLFCATIRLADHSHVILQIYATGMRLLDLMQARLLGDSHCALGSVARVVAHPGGFFCQLPDGALRQFAIVPQPEGQLLVEERNDVQCGPVRAIALFADQFLFLADDNGALSIFSLSTHTRLFFCPPFSRLPLALLHHSDDSAAHAVELHQRVVALDLLGVPGRDAECLLLVRYESAPAPRSRTIGCVTYRCQLPTREDSHPVPTFVRIDSTLLGTVDGECSWETARVSDSECVLLSPLRLAVQIAGVSTRLHLRLHELLATGVLSIAPYQGTSVIVLREEGTIDIVDLARTRQGLLIDWESGWYLRRIAPPADRSTTFVVWHPPSCTYLLASAPRTASFTMPVDEYSSISDHPPPPPGVSAAPQLLACQSTAIHLLNPASWTIVDEANDLLLPYETVTCMRTLELATRQTSTGLHPFLAIGTAYQKGEDRPIRGRCIVCDVAEVVPEPGRPETNRKLRIKGITDFKGPVMALAPLLDGNVAISLGPKIVIHGFEDDEKLAGVAFHDIGTCTVAIASIKSFFVAADLLASLSFLAFQAEPLARIHVLGSDYGQNIHCAATEFLINRDGQVLLVAGDAQGGLHFYAYAPNNLTTNAGQRLLDRGSFNLHGSPVNRLLRLPSPRVPGDFALVAAGQDGAIHMLRPLPVASFRRLFLLEMRLTTVLPRLDGLSSRVARQVPRRTTISHAPPVVGQTTLLLPTSALSLSGGTGASNTLINSTLILHHLPVSNAFVDGIALRRFHCDSLFDGLARQTLANRFGLDYDTLLRDLTDALAPTL